jgi:hypothetical protein
MGIFDPAIFDPAIFDCGNPVYTPPHVHQRQLHRRKRKPDWLEDPENRMLLQQYLQFKVTT